MMHGDERAKSQLPGYIFPEEQLLPINDTFSASDIVVYCSRSGIYSILSHLLMSPLGVFKLGRMVSTHTVCYGGIPNMTFHLTPIYLQEMRLYYKIPIR